jgi:hypothetical protein
VERSEEEKWRRQRELGWRNGACSPGVTTVTTNEVVLLASHSVLAGEKWETVEMNMNDKTATMIKGVRRSRSPSLSDLAVGEKKSSIRNNRAVRRSVGVAHLKQLNARSMQNYSVLGERWMQIIMAVPEVRCLKVQRQSGPLVCGSSQFRNSCPSPPSIGCCFYRVVVHCDDIAQQGCSTRRDKPHALPLTYTSSDGG